MILPQEGPPKQYFFATRIKDDLGKHLHHLGVSANFLSGLGLFFAFVSGVSVCRGAFFLAGSFLLISGILDLLDGATARASGKSTVYGGILDSTLDRYGDGFVLGALAIYGAGLPNAGLAVAFSLSALLGSFAISYVRARAECEIEECRVGFWERGERLVFLSIGFVTGNVWVTVVILGIGTHWTVAQRLFRANVIVCQPGRATAVNAPKKNHRFLTSYWIKVVFLVALVVFWRFVLY